MQPRQQPAAVVTAVLLAAGESRRMGGPNKLELLVAGEPLLRRTARVLLGAQLAEVVVVTGHESDKAWSLLDGLPLRVVHNETYREGQMTSVHAGLAALREPCDGVLICLADQPLLETQDVDFLVEAFARRAHGSVLVPTWQGRRGNPIVISHDNRAAILAGERNLGCKRLIENNPDLVCTLAMANDHVVVDIDTPGDYIKFCNSEKLQVVSG